MRPLVPILLAFISGIISQDFFIFRQDILIILFAASVLFGLLPIFLKIRFMSIIISPAFFFLGALFISPYLNPVLPQGHIRDFVRLYETNRHAFGQFSGAGMSAEGVIYQDPEYDGEKTRLRLDASKVFFENNWARTQGKIQLTVDGDLRDFSQGDIVRFTGSLHEPFDLGNPGEFSYKKRLGFEGVFVSGYVRSERLLSRVEMGRPGLLAQISLYRKKLKNNIENSGLKNKGALSALLIGDRSYIDDAMNNAFRKTGTSHILAISGLHLSIVALLSFSLILYILKRSERIMLMINAKKAAALAALFPVLFYSGISGFPVSTRRAAIMAAVFVFVFLINRAKDYYNTLALAALAILAVAPYAIWDAAFQLTFAAVFSLVYIIPRFSGLLEFKTDAHDAKWKIYSILFARKTCLYALVTVAASIGTYPILAKHFNLIPVTGALANLLAVPVIGFFTVSLLLLYAFLMPISGLAADVFLRLADVSFSIGYWIIKTFAGLPLASVRVATPGLLVIALIYAFFFFLVNIRQRRVFIYPAVLALSLIIGLKAHDLYKDKTDEELRVTFLSVGQGESALVEFPRGKKMLIDAGGWYAKGFDPGERIISRFLWNRGITSLDQVVLTHPQLDHMAGLKFIANNFAIDEFWWNGDWLPADFYRAIEENGAIKTRIDALDTRINGVRVRALHPAKSAFKDVNDRSIVLKLDYGEASFLFTGDIGIEAEKELLNKDIRTAVLKVPHHGSMNSSCADFIEKTSPKYAVISAGRRNVFNFPAVDVIKRYEGAGAAVYRTDMDGAITVYTSGKAIDIKTHLTRKGP